jgi:hypothetical protein
MVGNRDSGVRADGFWEEFRREKFKSKNPSLPLAY